QLAVRAGSVCRPRREDGVDSRGGDLDGRGFVEVRPHRLRAELPETDRARRLEVTGAGAHRVTAGEKPLRDPPEAPGGSQDQDPHELTSLPTAPISSWTCSSLAPSPARMQLRTWSSTSPRAILLSAAWAASIWVRTSMQ